MIPKERKIGYYEERIGAYLERNYNLGRKDNVKVGMDYGRSADEKIKKLEDKIKKLEAK